jgi:hypothetical protein
MPRRRSIRIVSLIAVALVCAFIAYVVSNRWTPGASFQGHSASYWLRQIVRPQIVGSPIFSPQKTGPFLLLGPARYLYLGPTSSPAVEAFDKMGTNAEPVLVAAIEARENPLTSLFRRVYPRLPAAIRQRLPEPYDPLALRSAALFVLRNTASIHITPKLLPLLQKPDSALRLAVLSVIVKPDASQIPSLLLARDDPDAKVRREVLRCLSQIGHSATAAVSAVSELCADSDRDVRQDAAWTLWKITGQTNTTVPVLEELLSQQHDEDRRHQAAYDLLVMGDSAPTLVTTLINSLTNRQAGDRATVCSFLRDIGPPAAAAIPALRKALQDPEPEVRRRAEVALSRIDPEHAATPAP